MSELNQKPTRTPKETDQVPEGKDLRPVSGFTQAVPIEYVTLLHDLIAGYHDKLSESLSPVVAETCRGTLIDKLMKKMHMPGGKDTLSVVKEMLTRWGFKLETVAVGDELRCKIECPFAANVHPLLAHTMECPVAYVVLGAVRQEESGSRMIRNHLLPNGVDFSMKREKRLLP
jgi:hypothetical protein